MFVKWIVCRVMPEQRQAFSSSQEKWAALTGTDGFIAQLGGWNSSDPFEACIMGIWSDAEHYRHFMENVHDTIYEKSGQKETYHSIDISFYRKVMDIPGEARDFQSSIMGAKWLRMANPLIYRERVRHFEEVQKKVWNPGMAAAGGMLGGVFARAEEVEQYCEKQMVIRYLTASLWENDEAHMNYVRNHFPLLNLKAEVGRDIQHIEGKLVRLVETWSVL